MKKIRQQMSSVPIGCSGLAVGLFGLAVAGCSDGPKRAPSATSSTEIGASTDVHAIKVFAKRADGSAALLRFGQGTEIAATTSRDSLEEPDVSAAADRGPMPFTGRTGLAPESSDAGGTPMVPVTTVGNAAGSVAAASTAWLLVTRAAAQCDPAAILAMPPWQSIDDSMAPAWYTSYADELVSCSDRLQFEQNLICVADKLSAVADAVGTTVWPAVGGADGGAFSYSAGAGALGAGTEFYDEWDIPPQADGDRFILRDLAIHTLAMIPTVDAFTDLNPLGAVPPATCAQTWAAIAAAGTVSMSQLYAAFGVSSVTNFPTFPPSPVPFVDDAGNSNVAPIAQSALEINALILRSGGRLLHDLIRRDVYSDMAAAAQASAASMDPGAGNQAAWGQSTQGAYGSIAHAARVLLGRWELGDPSAFANLADPKCEGTAAIDLVPRAFGSDLVARLADLPIRTPGEETASRLVEQAGIVVPACAVNTAAAPALKRMLAAQLVCAQTGATVCPPTSPPAAVATAIDQRLSALTNEEIVFAFQRAFATWSLLTNTAAGASVSDAGMPQCPSLLFAWDAGLNPGVADPSVAAPYGGIVVQGGLARARMGTDPLARVGGMTEASQCPLATITSNGIESTPTGWSEWGSDQGAAIDGANVGLNRPGTVQYHLPPGVFQDSFHVGQAFERRLNVLQNAAAQLPAFPDPGNVARGGIAELRTWAGNAVVHAWPLLQSSGPGTVVPAMQVRIAGMSMADFGLNAGADLTPIKQAFGFVYGPPWVAECAAHLRPDCPTKFDTTYVQIASAAADVTPSYSSQGLGFLDSVFSLTVPIANGVPHFTPPVVNTVFGGGPAAPGESHLYMVRLRDPGAQSGKGRVLGTLPLSTVTTAGNMQAPATTVAQIVGFVDAPMQRELVHNAIDLGNWVGAKPPALGDPSAAATSGFCVDGVARDVFVPLDNELVSGTASYEDSWQHYLDLAKEAALTADTLGQQLIANDLQISQNQQAAEEQLANICGDFGLLSTATISQNGTVTAGNADPTVSSCLSEQFVDVVFLGQLPPTIPSDAGADAQTGPLKAVLGCSNDGGPPPSAQILCGKASLTADALNIVKIADAGPPATDAGPQALAPVCNQLATYVTQSLKTNFQGSEFTGLLGDDTFGTDALGSLAGSLVMNVDLSGNWVLSSNVNGQKFLGSDPTLWPGCQQKGLAANACMPALAPIAGGNAATMWSALEATFRPECSNANLGSCSSTAQAELNLVRWRVTQALWMMAVSSGSLPEGMFNVPVPGLFFPGDGLIDIYNSTGIYSNQAPNAGGQLAVTPIFLWGASAADVLSHMDTYTTGNAMGLYDGTPLPVACPDGRTGPDGGLGCAVLDPNGPDTSAGDIRTAGTLYPVASQFTAYPPTASNEIPAWYLRNYDPALPGTPPLYHVSATNTSLTFPQCKLSGKCVDATSSTSSVTTAAPVSLQSLMQRAPLLDGIACSTPYGEATRNGQSLPAPRDVAITNGNWTSWWEGVAVAKQGGVLQVAPTSAGALGCNSDKIPQQGEVYPNGGWQVIGEAGYGHARRPTCLPPAARVFEYVGHNARPNGTCGAASLLLQTAVLSCLPAPGATAIDISALTPSQPPPIVTMADVPRFEAWLGLVASQVALDVSYAYVQSIPQQAVRDFHAGTVGSGSLGGTNGQAVLSMEQDILGFPTNWIQLSLDLTDVRAALQAAALAVNAANLKNDSTLGSLAIQQIGVQQNMATSVGAFMQAVGSAMSGGIGLGGIGSPISLAGSGLILDAQLSADNQELGVLQKLATNADQTQQNDVAQALATLAGSTASRWADIQATLIKIRANIAQLDADGQSVRLAQGQAAYQAAIGTGSDFVRIGNQDVAIPVNTVLRRQASATEKRYQVALTNAKTLAYMARRAIEQRIGVPLDAFTQSVGPLDPPALWADSLCSLHGVNYASLSTATPAGQDGGGIGGSADQSAISQFADGWIGDYVAKLAEFVTFYNVQYPSHQGNDTAVLSLRYDLLGPKATCSAQAANLLANSGDLSRTSSASWQTTPCAGQSSKCLQVVSGYALAPPLDGPWGAQGTAVNADPGGLNVGSGVTWLVDVPQAPPVDGGVLTVDASVDAFADGAGDATVVSPPAPLATASWPNNVVARQLELAPGTYVLSWWDQARDPKNGALVYSTAPSAPVPYVVQVFDPAWASVSTTNPIPYPPAPAGDGAPPSLWSTRRTLSFTVANDGPYTVAFGASVLGGSLGSVAIADVQLELAPTGQPSDYVSTTDTTIVAAYNCPRSDSDLRSSFTRACDSHGRCWYDLMSPLIIDTSSLTGGGSSMGGKLAEGNFNYRDLDLAVNLVGTGVRSCAHDSNPNCYGSGYIEYDLQHDATNAGIVGYDGNSRIFDFGSASVNHGKALAAERYLTMPLSSSDQQLVTQPGIQHIEFGGRPLDGTYHLRIWDSPDLDWSRLEDIQVVVNYEYWTNIIANGNHAKPMPLSGPRVKPVIAPQRGRTLHAQR